jgi:prevent-host-death family protein
MGSIINVHEVKTHLSRILEEVAAGAEVIIAKAGKPVARLVPIKPLPKPKQLGQLRGQIKVPDDLNSPLPAEVLADFEAR